LIKILFHKYKKILLSYFPDLTVVLRIKLSIKATNRKREPFFSALKLIKRSLRSKTASTRLNALFLLNIENKRLKAKIIFIK
jgi:hypothetical protein